MHMKEVQALDDIQGNAAAHPVPLQLARPLPQPLHCMLQVAPLQQRMRMLPKVACVYALGHEGCI